MSHRFFTSLGVLAAASALISLALTPAAAQTSTAERKTWTVPRTPDGRPDLQGIWTNQTVTPLERPETLGDQQTLTEEEARQREEQAVERIERAALPSEADREILPARDNNQPGGYNSFWIDRGTNVLTIDGKRRTSLIVDPPNGRIPPLTPEGQLRADARAERRRQGGRFDHPEQRPLGERCIMGFGSTSGPPMLPVMYNNNYQFVQTPDHLMILVEMVHDARIIPLDGRPHAPENVRKWLGDSVGHWEGDTLVVETTNFSDKTRFRGSTESLRVIERFTRVAEDSILYEFTVDDPATYSQAWTGQIAFVARESNSQIFEYACHEGNYALPGILAGARLLEKEAAEAEVR